MRRSRFITTVVLGALVSGVLQPVLAEAPAFVSPVNPLHVMSSLGEVLKPAETIRLLRANPAGELELRSQGLVNIAPVDNIPDEAGLPVATDEPSSKQLSAPVPATALHFGKPLDQIRISSGYGPRSGHYHKGVDLLAPAGTPIHASEGGKVAFSGWYYGYGNLVVVDHGGGMLTRYGHASKILVKAGQPVSKGQTIALVGSTGRATCTHLHFEVLAKGQHRNPVSYIGRSIPLAATKPVKPVAEKTTPKPAQEKREVGVAEVGGGGGLSPVRNGLAASQ